MFIHILCSTYTGNSCADSNIIESKVTDVNYCYKTPTGIPYLAPTARSNKYNCDGTINTYTNANCTKLLTANMYIPADPNNQCIPVSSSAGKKSNGAFKFLTCTNNTVLYHTTSWIAITAYNDASCTAGSSGWVSYACGSCMPLGNGAYYKLTCSQTAAGVDYRFANYTSSNCALGLIYSDPVPVPANLRPADSCIPRATGNNLAEAEDFDTGFYAYAKYTVITGSTPPSPPYTGYFKV